ncbi:MAG: EscU/YscU/HrcU family type III secretion system export apparatus switch protein [Thermodesulfobacteriaceae bacterium]|nr:EscU/YscU/HrcU family type III secretion system export apparatus switch protein [Thermodesulfobacteriaceae bacterium]MCX8041438.1 EscU/YscU/HrcU family type III secretion system export apparatus switch protein [Thermodesulfobacteriaceae bacterium]MDW8135393.1 EscU/YscU/HrcU family type III secretion system export apparatus switch protein [Thermodesulfobacterium sp.]
MAEEKDKTAVALQYNPEEEVPKVVAKGKGYLAELILEIAKKYGIPIKKDDKLVKELYKLELEKPIPPELYQAVAIVLSWALRLNQKLKEKVLKSLEERYSSK